VKQSKVRFLLGQERQKLAERSQDSKSRVPAIAVPGAEQRALPHHVNRQQPCRQLTMYRLGDH
jgi:hypothetical protein